MTSNSSQESLFNSVFPAGTVPTPPEFLRKNQFTGMMPQEINYPYGAGPIVYDSITGHLYIEATANLDPDYTNPTYFGDNRSAIMRVYEKSEDGEVIDGFIADMRFMGNSAPHERTITQSTGFDELGRIDQIMEESALKEAGKYKPLLAVAFKDLNGDTLFVGDPRLKDTMTALVLLTNAMKNKDTSPEPSNKVTDELPASPLSGDYYLG